MRKILAEDSESKWLNSALMGDVQAFTLLVDSYQNPVFNLCYRMLGNKEDAEDASQETFLRAYKSLKRYDKKRSFSTWLLSIAAHYCIDQIRKRRFQFVSTEELVRSELTDPSMGVEEKVLNKEDQSRIQEILHELNPKDRAIVIMYYWYDFSYDEICQSLSLSNSAVKSRLHRSRRMLADIWRERIPENLFVERITAT